MSSQISSHPPPVSQLRMSSIHSNPPATNALATQEPAATRFLEQNAWTNPKHPAHRQQYQQMQRKSSARSHPTTPTPGLQRRTIGLNAAQESVSTMADRPSGQNTSLAATPLTLEQGRGAPPVPLATPSNLAFSPHNNTKATVNGGDIPESALQLPQEGDITSRPASISESNNQAYRSNHSGEGQSTLQRGASKVAPTQNLASSSIVGNQASPTMRYPKVKTEDINFPPREPSVLQLQQTSVATGPVSRS